MQEYKKLSVIIPAYNESITIGEVLDRILRVDLGVLEREIIVVDDASTDNTVEQVRKVIENRKYDSIRLLSGEENMGKGAAIHSGLRVAEGDLIIIQDADLEYDPGDYRLLLAPILENRADVVYGSRFSGRRGASSRITLHRAGNRFLTGLSNLFTGLRLTDMETCYKLFRASIIKEMELREKRFGFEPEVTARLSKIRGIRIAEVPISYFGRLYSEGKKITWKDGIRAIYCIIRYNLF